MLTLDDALRRYALPRLEARMLLLHVVPGLTHARLVGFGEDVLDEQAERDFCRLAERRLAGEPMAYLIGCREFFGREFQVSPAVLIPRPDTELLVEAVLQRVPPNGRVVDLGSGSGAICVTVALEAAELEVSAVDISADALAVARGNAERLGAKVMFYQGSWYDPLPQGGRFDVVVSNPPYIAQHDHHLDQGDVRHEPRLALTDGGDGLACLREIAAGALAHLQPGGWLLVEHGYDQGGATRSLFDAAGLLEVATLQDLAGLDRVTLGRSPVGDERPA